MKHNSFPNTQRLSKELAGLTALDREKLREKWRVVYGTEPPSEFRSSLLMHAIAHRMQEQVLGGLKPTALDFLRKAEKDRTPGRKISPYISVKPGTRLLREWHGVTYEAIVMEDCVYCNGKRYRSLTGVANAITGTQWSCTEFFGLKKKKKKRKGSPWA